MSRVESLPPAEFDGPTYSSVKELAADGDIVVSGRVLALRSEIMESELQGRPKPSTGPDLPLALYEVAVERTLKGAGAKNFLVMLLDTKKINTTDQTALRINAKMLFFLKSTGITQGALPVYTLVGMDQGQLEEVDGRLRAPGQAEPVERSGAQKSAGSEGGSPGDGQTIEEIAQQLK